MNEYELGSKLMRLAAEQAKWSQSTFGSDADRGPLGALKHLEKEAREAQDSVGTSEIRMELADCFLLTIDAARRAGVDIHDLVAAAATKQLINRHRKWPTPVTDEPVEHVRTGDDKEHENLICDD